MCVNVRVRSSLESLKYTTNRCTLQLSFHLEKACIYIHTIVWRLSYYFFTGEIPHYCICFNGNQKKQDATEEPLEHAEHMPSDVCECKSEKCAGEFEIQNKAVCPPFSIPPTEGNCKYHSTCGLSFN